MNRKRLAAVLLAAVVGLSGCAANAAQSGAEAGQATPSPTPSPSADAAATPTAQVLGARWHHPLQQPVVIEAAHGTISSVVLRGGGATVAGRTARHRQRWLSTGRLFPETRYRAVVRLRDADGQQAVRRLALRTGKAAATLTMTATPGPGWTRGVGEPIVVTFNRPVPHRAVVERHMTVTTDGKRLAGAWHWFSRTVVHYRPRHFWPANTTVHVHIDLRRVYAGRGIWGDRNHDWTWRTGDRHVSYVNAQKHTFRATVNGALFGRWPTGTGMPGYSTREGVYSVLSKSPTVEMTSCSVGLSCTPGDPNYYDLTVHWDTRLTASGTFVHAAPWDSQMGYANTSHGCIHLPTEDARKFYRLSIPGDVVIVRGTGRAPDLPADPGMMDWNMSWTQWLAGSAVPHRVPSG